MLRDPRLAHHALELENESKMYQLMWDCSDAVPVFFGFTNKSGVPLILLSAEVPTITNASIGINGHLSQCLQGSNFEDIGIENLPLSLRVSAVRALKKISSLGILHGDIALRNVVRSKQQARY